MIKKGFLMKFFIGRKFLKITKLLKILYLGLDLEIFRGGLKYSTQSHEIRHLRCLRARKVNSGWARVWDK